MIASNCLQYLQRSCSTFVMRDISEIKRYICYIYIHYDDVRSRFAFQVPAVQGHPSSLLGRAPLDCGCARLRWHWRHLPVKLRNNYIVDILRIVSIWFWRLYTAVFRGHWLIKIVRCTCNVFVFVSASTESEPYNGGFELDFINRFLVFTVHAASSDFESDPYQVFAGSSSRLTNSGKQWLNENRDFTDLNLWALFSWHLNYRCSTFYSQ